MQEVCFLENPENDCSKIFSIMATFNNAKCKEAIFQSKSTIHTASHEVCGERQKRRQVWVAPTITCERNAA
jgi:hypothetical protein